MSDLDNNDVSKRVGNPVTSTSTSTSTSTTSSTANGGDQTNAEPSGKILPHPGQPSGQKAGQDTRISLIQVG